MIYIGMLLGGLALLGWNTWQRLGRSRAARSWVDDGKGRFAERNTLVLWPLLGVALLLAAALGPAQDSSGPASVVFGLLFLAVLLLWFGYLMLPLPVPRWAQPAWYRELAQGPTSRGGVRA